MLSLLRTASQDAEAAKPSLSSSQRNLAIVHSSTRHNPFAMSLPAIRPNVSDLSTLVAGGYS
jgi:hypothetical protein